MRMTTGVLLSLLALLARGEPGSSTNEARDNGKAAVPSGSVGIITTFHGGKAVVAQLGADEIAKTPQWQPRTGQAVPLSAADASRLAGDALTRHFGADVFVVEAVDLRRYRNSDHWYYLVGFRGAGVAGRASLDWVTAFPDGLVQVAVLMSGHVPVHVIKWPPVGEKTVDGRAPGSPPDLGTQNR